MSLPLSLRRMEYRLSQAIERFRDDLRPWLTQPGPQSQRLASLRQQIEQMGDALSKGAQREMLRPLELAEQNARRARAFEAAKAIASILAEEGVMLEPKATPPRKRRSKKTAPKSAPSNEAEQA